MKKPELKIIRPSEAVASLDAYNEKVFALVHVVNLALQYNLIDKKIAADIKEANKAVEIFYQL